MTDDRAGTQLGPDDVLRSDAATTPKARKPYEPPRLVEYGDIASLTQTGGASQSDGKAPRKLKG